MTAPLILASASRFRRQMLEDAGVAVETERPQVDERALEAGLKGASPEKLATELAQAKALEVSRRKPGRLVLGCDQTLSLGERLFHKPSSRETAQQHITDLAGQTHHLNSAAALALDGEIVWNTIGIARLSMRALKPETIDRYLDRAGDAVLESVGAYQIEGIGITLFERIEGDFWTIVGLPLLPVLAALRERGIGDA